jgi:hypothetical protein
LHHHLPQVPPEPLVQLVPLLLLVLLEPQLEPLLLLLVQGQVQLVPGQLVPPLVLVL